MSKLDLHSATGMQLNILKLFLHSLENSENFALQLRDNANKYETQELTLFILNTYDFIRARSTSYIKTSKVLFCCFVVFSFLCYVILIYTVQDQLLFCGVLTGVLIFLFTGHDFDFFLNEVMMFQD